MWCRPIPLPPHSSKPLFSVSAATADKCCWKKTDEQKSRGERDWNNHSESVGEKAEESSAAEELARRPSAKAGVWECTTCTVPHYVSKQLCKEPTSQPPFSGPGRSFIFHPNTWKTRQEDPESKVSLSYTVTKQRKRQNQTHFKWSTLSSEVV